MKQWMPFGNDNETNDHKSWLVRSQRNLSTFNRMLKLLFMFLRVSNKIFNFLIKKKIFLLGLRVSNSLTSNSLKHSYLFHNKLQKNVFASLQW